MNKNFELVNNKKRKKVNTMAKFRESELTEILQEFQKNDTIELEFEKSITGKMKLEEANVNYDGKYGFINIKSKNSTFQINTTLVCGYEKIDDEINIDLETLLLKFRKTK